MPVRRFRNVADMERAKWRQAGDPDLFRAIAAIWEFGRRSRPPLSAGVYRHRSIAAEAFDAAHERGKATIKSTCGWCSTGFPKSVLPSDRINHCHELVARRAASARR